MEVYLIRHGETGGNQAHRHQPEDISLNKRGLEQARQVALTVKEFEPSHLLTSPLVRALQTAREIGEVCDLVPETNVNFAELKRPDDMYGRYHTSLKSLAFYARWFLGKTDGGESYQDLRHRIAKAKSHFRSYPENARVVVVSHSVFINLFLVHMCHEDEINLFTASKAFMKILTMKNTELIPLIYDPETHTDTCGWFQDKT
jgi:broad specificity phosphatase PhoE